MDIQPAWLARAMAERGQREVSGPRSNPRILEYRRMAGIAIGGEDSIVPWCAIFVGAMLALAGLRGSGSAMARSYVHYGAPLPEPCPGAIVPLASPSRPPPSGHVAFATGRWTATHVELIGGNQGDAVSIGWFPLHLVLAYRWPDGVVMPNARAVRVSAAAPAAAIKDV